MKNTFKILILTVAAAVAVPLQMYLVDQQSLHLLLAMAVAVPIGAVLAFLLEMVLLRLPQFVPALRLLVDPNSALEGMWLERVEGVPDRPISLATIEYDPKKQQHLFKGKAFDRTGNLSVRFWSKNIVIDAGEGRMVSFGEGVVLANHDHVVQHVCEIGFDRPGPARFLRRFSTGTGSFFDLEEGARLVHFTIDRVTPGEIKRILKKKTISTAEDTKIFLRPYLADLNSGEDS